MPTKTYIWGYITGITVILLGVAPILASFIYWVDGEWIFSFTKPLVISIQSIDVELTYPGLSTEVLTTIFGVIILVGGLIVFKKSLGWYVQYPFLFLLGGVFLFLAGILVEYQINNRVDFDTLFGTAAFLALSAFFFALLWIQVRYWRNRKAML
jgi:hypothetical protein